MQIIHTTSYLRQQKIITGKEKYIMKTKLKALPFGFSNISPGVSKEAVVSHLS